MNSSPLLTEDEITTGLARLTGWRRQGEMITRTAEAADFPTAIRVVAEVAEVAEGMDHHPDIDIRWRRLTFALTTHSADGVTDLDLRLAARIDQALDRQV
ncbi:4a-hydroxytetrahydrobiopterin dehydratase [Kitasatospora sp. NPDC008050]|uniref:4a-hydroxytetrahydrobiopterin dehydratase n=1 Tax=Kitasatospora sp. NPDC008050 TaxID=3364021 RepID=UPI0036E2338C